MDCYVFTFDIDWAPDFAIEMCAQLCEKYHIPATFFISHDSLFIRSLEFNPLLHRGIHPNFTQNSSHGDNPREILEFCLRIAPESRAMRTHCLHQSSHIFNLVADCFPQLEIDSSIFLPGMSSVRPVDVYHGKNNRRITRIPFYWGDYNFARRPGWDWAASPPPSSALRVFNFHPALVALNIRELAPYNALKQAIGSRPLNTATREDFAPFVNNGVGARDFLLRVASLASRARHASLSEVVDEYRRDERCG